MPTRHFLTTLFITLGLAGAASAQTVLLSEAPLVDSCTRVQLTLELKGKLTFQRQGKTETLEHDASAEHIYLERVLEAKGGMAAKTARVYETAKATIAGQTRTLRSKYGLMVAHRVKDQLITYSIEGPLLPEEMELTEHFDTLAVPGLLPGKEVKVGESWSVPPAVIQAICGLDALDATVKQDFTGTLTSVNGNLARASFQGTVKGINLGAPVSIIITKKSNLAFDLKEKRIVDLAWFQSDDRKQGPATPNLAADVVIKLQRTPIEEPNELNNLALVRVPNGEPPARLTNIVHQDAKAKYEFQHGREWQFVGEHEGKRILKLVSARGDYLADAILMPWQGPKIASGEAFQQAMDQAVGWQQDGDSQLDATYKHPNGYTTYRVAAAGKMEAVPAYRTAYLVCGAAGQQLLVTVIAPLSQVNNLATRDQILVESVEFK